MSTITRILIVAVAVLSFVYLGISAALFAYRVDYKNRWETEQAAHKKTITEKDNAINELKGAVADRDNSIKALNADKTNLTTQRDQSRDELVTQQTQNTTLANSLKDLGDNYEKLQASLNEQMKKNQDLNATVDDLRKSKEDAVKERTVLEEKFINAQDSIIKLEKNLSTLEQQYLAQAKEFEKAKTALAAYISAAPGLASTQPTKYIEGKIVAISDKPELNIVMINVGKNDGVEVGMKFTVYRADKYVAKIQIDKVEAQWASAASLKELQADTIRVNDNISTSAY
jgi:hypothetical protein